MATKLEKLLSFIDPDITLEKIFNRADKAINTFNLRTAKIDKWDQFSECVSGFSKHLDFHILNLQEKPDISASYYWPKGAHTLIKIYGINGEKVAFEMARTGNEGGLYKVLKAMAMRVAEDYAQNEIFAQISAYWRSLSVDEKFDASTEYIAKFGHLLPSELTEGSSARIRANFTNFLEKHPYLIQQIRRVGR